ncbi:MAG: hypothetical protein NTX97_01600, partial [Bacteroidetes bacterium]|nr:hypothetical protein [Bacteroidota bacterium]
NKKDWNSIVGHGSEFLRIPFLNVLEDQHPENMRFHYSIIYDKKKPIAIAYFQVIDFSSGSFGSNQDQNESDFYCIVADYLKKHLTNHLIRHADRRNIRILVCGNACVSGEHGFTCTPEANKIEAIDALSDVIHHISSKEKLRGQISAVLIKDFYSSSLSFTKEFEEYKYHDFLVEPNMVLTIQWNSFDEYMNAMSKKYRNRTKNIIKKGINIERRDFSVDDIKANSKQILQLYKNVHLKAKFRLATLPTSYFAEMKNALGDHFSFIGYYFENNLIGFRTTFILTSDIEAHFIGIDYSFNKDLDLYQNILCDYVKDSLLKRAKHLFLGRTASEIKSTFGAEALELTCYIRHRNPLSNRIIKPFVDYLKPSEWVPRNPFKEISI